MRRHSCITRKHVCKAHRLNYIPVKLNLSSDRDRGNLRTVE
ncbi:unnamed protein product [Amoebophrya sp. A25]|nr:unnamed protein product [Amoebophrya sp. A25]|eukprot:GSA25T00019742001.1